MEPIRGAEMPAMWSDLYAQLRPLEEEGGVATYDSPLFLRLAPFGSLFGPDNDGVTREHICTAVSTGRKQCIDADLIVYEPHI